MEEALGEIIGANEARKVLIARVNEDRTDLGGAWSRVHSTRRLAWLIRVSLSSCCVRLPGECVRMMDGGLYTYYLTIVLVR